MGSSALALALVISAPAMAQAAQDVATIATPPKDEVIIVTGTRVSQKVADQPIDVISGDVLNKQGYTNVGDALTTLPIFGTPANSTVGGQGSFGAGQTFINLYNLGSERTLTLVNGNRFVGAATSSIFGASVGTPVDLGQIAPSLVDHIDIVSVGGAPIYGADAIAGTVNIVLKHNYQGAELTSSDGVSGQGDARDYNFNLLIGHNFADGRGNVTLNVYYDHQDGLTSAQRPLTGGSSAFYEYANGNSPYQQVVYQGGLRYNAFSNTGIPMSADSVPFNAAAFGYPSAQITNAAGQALYFNKQGQLVPFANGAATGYPIVEAGGDGFSINDYGNLLTSSNRIQGTLLGHYDVSDHLRVHGEIWWGRDTATNLVDQPYYSTALFGPSGTVNGNLALSTTNPYLSAADSALLQAESGSTFYLARANTDLATGSFTSTSYLFRVVGGIDGDFMLGSHSLTWDVTVNYGRTATITTQSELVTQNFFNALNAVTGSNGSIICAPGYTSAAIATLSSTCAPLDIFGSGNESQAALNYVTAIAKTNQIDTQFDFVADLKGDIVDLPGGKVKFALGVEARRESQSFDPGAFFLGQEQSNGTYTQYGNSIPITPVDGSYHTHEFFGELTVPLLSDDQHIPLVHELTAHGAARYTDNSLNGSNWSYTVGGNYAPIGGFTFRGNYTKSFREPSVTEAFAPMGSVFETANDPCDTTNINGGPNPATRAANCAKAGIPVGFQSNVDNFTVEGSSSGSTHLQNELADSWTAGVQVTPHFIPGLQITADYISISIKNEITIPGLTAEMDACYDSSNYPANPYCSTFTRDANGQVINFTDNYSNIAIEGYRALQGGLTYRLPLTRIGLPQSAGALNVTSTYLHVYRHYTRLGEQDEQIILGDYVDPVDAVTTNFDWQTPKFDWLWTVIYNGPSLINPDDAANTYEYPRVSPYWMVNTSVGLNVNDHFNIRLTVNNIFNLGVPNPQVVLPTTNQNQGETAKYWDAIMGRYFRLTVKIKL